MLPRTTFSVVFFCEKTKVTKKGKAPIYARITILETYASRAAYEKHIASAHFQKYKQSTLHMVRSLELVDQTPLNPANCLRNFIQHR